MYLCDYCRDPAQIVEERKEPFFPFKVVQVLAFCYDCHREVIYKQLPRLTDSPYRSRKGSGIQKRKRYLN